ncbi:MAG: NADH-quinone oxidoreductase subunit M [bacterium]|nr:NADH-quinone oxidoreductase subunit M [bacterium]MBU1917377.1 NADH-quinone oxidoreductase subunit M [bacterium]
MVENVNFFSDLINEPYLTLLIFLPLMGILILSFIPRHNHTLLKGLTLLIFAIEALISFKVYSLFQNTGMLSEFMVNIPWIKSWHIYYFLGIDGVSLLLIVLTTITMPLTLIGTWHAVQKNVKFYLICLLFLQTGIIGVFSALDLFLFYVFWEVMLIPMYFLIGVWGGENRIYASLKFFIYTMAGSVIMLVAILYLYFQAGQSFNLLELYNYHLSFTAQCLVFLALALAFAIKVPLFPFHTWLPDAHVQAPTAGSVILAGILLKMGTYGFFRFGIPLFPEAMIYFQDYLMIIAVIGIIYGALVAMVQPDMKKLIAYSSVSHMGVVMLGLFSLNITGMTGGLYQVFNHAISTGALFLLIGMLYDRTHTRQIKDYSGLAKLMPAYAICFIVVTLSSIGVPLTNGFVGEFLTLLGTFQVNPIMGILGTTGVVLGAVYMLWLVERIFFGPVKETKGTHKDLNAREIAVMVIIMIFIFWLGIFPKSFLTKIESSAEIILLTMDDERFLTTTEIVE